MRTLDRYIIRQFLLNFVILLAVLMALFVLVDLIVDLDEFLQAGETQKDRWFGVWIVAVLASIVDYYGPVALLIYVFFGGLIVVAAMGFTVTGLQRQRELTAMLAGGISLYRVAMPVVFAGALLSLVTLPVQEFVLPSLAPKLLRAKSDLKREGVQERALLYIADDAGNLWSAGSFDPAAEMMRDVRIVERDNAGLLTRLVLASEAVWNEDGRRWELTQGYARQPAQQTEVLSASAPEPEPVEAVASELSPTVLMAKRATILPTVLSVSELQALSDNPAIGASQRAVITRTIWGRFSLLILNVLLVVMALPYFLRRVPGDAMKRSVQAAGLCLGVWGGSVMMLQASPEAIPPVVSAWLPVAIYLPVSAYLLTTIRT